ncbi:MAG TPA: ATP-binding protein [Kofleriaceae bacterium]
MTERPPIALSLPALLDALTRANIGVVVFLQRDGRLDKWFANAPGIEPLGYTHDEWLAKPAFEVIPAGQRQRIAELYDRLASTDDPLPAAIELDLEARDGRMLRLEFSVGRAVLAEGHAFVLVLRGKLARAQLTLLEADRVALVGALAAGFAHETNNPLTSVLLNLRALRKLLVANLATETQAPALRCLDDITTGAERIASNVRALQTLATRSATQSLDLAAIVSAALRLAAPTLEPRAHVIRQIFPVRAVTGEESRIGQAVLAMLLFSSSGFDETIATATNRIVIAVEERAGSAVVEVSDNGHELSDDEAQRAFDPFYRSSARGSGVGVGLGVARSVASTLGGSVVLAPRSGGGAVITMTLPLAPA